MLLMLAVSSVKPPLTSRSVKLSGSFLIGLWASSCLLDYQTQQQSINIARKTRPNLYYQHRIVPREILNKLSFTETNVDKVLAF